MGPTIVGELGPFNPSGLTPGFVLAFVLIDLVIIIVAARLCGALAKRVGQPAVVGEIIAGILLGPSLLGPNIFEWANPPAFLHCDVSNPEGATASITACLFPPQAKSFLGVLGQIALVFYMFLVGAEVKGRQLRGKGTGIGLVSVGSILVPIAVGFAITPMLFDDKFVAGFGTPAEPSRLGFTLFVGALLSVTAFPVMARILQEKGLTTSDMGGTGIAAAGVVTILMFLTIATADAVAKEKGPGPIITVWVLTAIYLAVMQIGVKAALRPLARRFEERGALTPDGFAVLIGVALLSGYVADRIGINVIVGGFMAGLALPQPRRKLFEAMEAKIGDLTGTFLLPIFLAFSGLNTDFTQLQVGAVPGIVVIVVAGIVAKLAGGAVFARLGGLSWAEGTVIGVLMNCRGLLVLVAALAAIQAGAISPLLQLSCVVMALVTTAMTGPLFDATIDKVPSGDDDSEPTPEPVASS